VAVARLSGDVRVAQALLGHATLGTTETYLAEATLDQLREAVAPIRLLSAPSELANPVEAPTGIEPVYAALQAAA
jgi:hypothetical protein